MAFTYFFRSISPLRYCDTVIGFLFILSFSCFSTGAGFSQKALFHICICLQLVQHVNKNVDIPVRRVELTVELANTKNVHAFIRTITCWVFYGANKLILPAWAYIYYR